MTPTMLSCMHRARWTHRSIGLTRIYVGSYIDVRIPHAHQLAASIGWNHSGIGKHYASRTLPTRIPV